MSAPNLTASMVFQFVTAVEPSFKATLLVPAPVTVRVPVKVSPTKPAVWSRAQVKVRPPSVLVSGTV